MLTDADIKAIRREAIIGSAACVIGPLLALCGLVVSGAATVLVAVFMLVLIMIRVHRSTH